ncbi:MAG: hypothetical protein CM15mP109_04160 [Candidatus Dadabacteria bacterium]|nr:MAG: hypothetical protein CM15mP109_04160 [Candidatus Dadabacteria bacterium]
MSLEKLQGFACDTLGIELKSVYAPSGIVSHEGQGLTAVEKSLTKMLLAFQMIQFYIADLMLG